MKINTIHTYIRKACSTALTMLCCTMLFSCVEVDLCEEATHSHLGDIKLFYHWPEEIAEDQRPDSMLALINRRVTTHHIGYFTDSETSMGGRYHFGMDNNIVTDSVGELQPLKARTGGYWIFAFNKDIIDDTTHYQNNLDKFFNEKSSEAIGARAIYVSYVAHDLTGSILSDYSKEWVDFNPYSKYIAPNIKPIYSTHNKNNENQDDFFDVPKEGKAEEVHLYPQKITQDITISFPIYCDRSVRIDSIIAEISGIPHKMLVYDRILESDTTYKMFFKMNTVTLSVDTVINSEEYHQKIECDKTISVMGLLANKSPEQTIGAGILQLCIYLQPTDDNTVPKKYTKINLYHIINQANLVIADDQGNIIQNPGNNPKYPFSNMLRIDNNTLSITRDFVLKTLNNNTSLDTWIGDSDGDGKVDDDDHKLELEM